MMRGQAFERFAWALDVVEPGRAALYAVHVDADESVVELSSQLRARGVDSVTLDRARSHELVLRVLEPGWTPTESSAEALILTDALGPWPVTTRAQINRGRERLLSLGRRIVFAETKSGSPEAIAELRDLRAVLRDTFDLRSDVGEDDDLWDTGPMASLEQMGPRMPTTTRGATLIVRGRVRRKHAKLRRCPACGEVMESAVVELRFEHAPAETRVQRVPGYACACGERWPDPAQVRAAHAQAFGLG